MPAATATKPVLPFRPGQRIEDRSPTGAFHTTNTLYEDPASRARLCSVYPAAFHWHDGNGMYTLPAWKPGGLAAFVEIRPAWEKEDKGDGRSKNDLNISARVVATAMIEDAGVARRGVFVPEGDMPTQDEIKAAIRARNDYWMNVDIPNADSVWAQTEDPKQVDGNAKYAAQVLGIAKPWAPSTLRGAAECPACKEQIKDGARICVHCKEILTWEAGNPVWPRDPALQSKRTA